MPNAILGTLYFFFLLLFLKVVLRRDWLAAVAFVGIFSLRAYGSSYWTVELPMYILIYAIAVLIVFRFGLVPLTCAIFTVDMLSSVPFTTDLSAWYMPTSVLALLSVLALAGWGCYHSLGGELLWQPEIN
jgi:hypothetical protein